MNALDIYTVNLEWEQCSKFDIQISLLMQYSAGKPRRRVSSVVEHSSANPKVPGSIPGLVSYRGHGL